MKHKPKINTDKPILAKFFIGFIKFLSYFSLANQQRIGSGIGSMLNLFPNYNRNVIRANLAVAFPSLSKQQILVLSKKTLQENAKSFTELGAIWEWSAAKQQSLITKVYGEELLDVAYKNNKGIIILSPHFGSWEVLSSYLGRKEPFSVLYQPPAIKSIENYINKVRTKVGSNPVPANRSGVKTIFKVLKQNKIVAILPDQDPGETGGVHAPFFKHPARTMTLVAKLANKTKASVLYMVGERLTNGKGFAVHILPADQEISATDELTATTALNKGVERCVAIKPSQYLWSYKRYRHPPKGTKDIYQ